MSDLFRTGLNPEKTGAGLRGIGFIIIVFAFLIASDKFVSGGNKPVPTSTTSAVPPTVIADSALQPALAKIDGAAKYSFAPQAAPSTPPRTLDAADVVVTANAAGMTALVNAKRCAPAVTVAMDSRVQPGLTYRACAVLHQGSVTPAAQTYIGELISLGARVALVDAGFDLPERTG